MSRFYLTTAIDYVNSRPHLGHALEKIAADVIARYRRLAGGDVRLVIGNDEHSQNVYRRARERGLDPVDYCDRMESEFRDVWSRLHISYDDFIRTTQPRHRAAVETFVRRSYEAGDIFEGHYEGWYCVSCEAFKQERELVEGLCPNHRTRPEWIKEKNFFFRLSAYRDRLLALYEQHPTFVAPETRRNEMLRVLEAGLEDISVSRAGQSWGIPLPFDPSSVVYVWYDALINYISAIGYGSDDELFRTWWPAGLHVIGKDITRFHCIVWPAMLMSAGLELPAQVFGHGFVLFKGEKMSKSLGTVLDPIEATGRVGPDPLRLYLTKEIVFGSDGDFTWDRFEEKYNVDLANNLGNLVNRVTAMAERYRGGRLSGRPMPGPLAEETTSAVAAYTKAMDGLALDQAAQAAFRLVDAGNEFIAASEPWTLAKRGEDARLDEVLWASAEALRVATVLLSPVMPSSAATILERLGAPERSVGELRLGRDATLRADGERRLTRGEALWPRLDPDQPAPPVTKEITVPDETAPGPPRVSIDDFMKVDLRVARVVAAERVPKSRKLLKLSVEIGTETRTIVAGLAEAYEPDALVGRTVAVVANLEPAKLMGIESNGMVLAASPDGGAPVLVGFDAPPDPGTRIR